MLIELEKVFLFSNRVVNLWNAVYQFVQFLQVSVDLADR